MLSLAWSQLFRRYSCNDTSAYRPTMGVCIWRLLYSLCTTLPYSPPGLYSIVFIYHFTKLINPGILKWIRVSVSEFCRFCNNRSKFPSCFCETILQTLHQFYSYNIFYYEWSSERQIISVNNKFDWKTPALWMSSIFHGYAISLTQIWRTN
jgi:hypothetical protein